MPSQVMPLTAETVSGIDPFQTELRVLHVLQPTEAGVWQYATQMADFQAGNGWDVHIAAAQPVPGAAHWHAWRAVRSPARGLVTESAQLSDIVDAVRPDVVVAHSSKAGLIARVTVRHRLPVVFIPHAWSFQALSGPAAGLARQWERVSARWTNALVCVSAGEVAAGSAAAVRAPYFLLPNPVLPSWTGQATGSGPEARKAADVVFFGRLSHQKGVDVLLSAWREVHRAVGSARLLVIGDGPQAAALRAEGVPGATFTGALDHPRALVESARVAVFPSRWEGLSLSLLEAMWSALSVVTSDVGGSEVVTESSGGALVTAGDPDALATALIRRLHEPALAVEEGRRNAEYVRRFHAFDTVADRLAAIISRAHAFGRPTRNVWTGGVLPRMAASTRPGGIGK